MTRSPASSPPRTGLLERRYGGAARAAPARATRRETLESAALLLGVPASGWVVSGPLLDAAIERSRDGGGAGERAALTAARRGHVYALAGTGTHLAARRAAGEPASLGARFRSLNEELLPTASGGSSTDAVEAYKRLDAVSPNAQAAALPVLLGGALLVSLVAAGGMALVLGPRAVPPPPEALGAARGLVALGGAATVILFGRAELRKLASGIVGAQDDRASVAATAAAVALTAACYAGPADWFEIRNLANLLLGVTVARAVQLPTFRASAAALVGVAAYDALGTLLPVTGGGAGAMEVVARDRLQRVAPLAAGAPGSVVWQPGILALVLRGRTTDALGLADFIFPSIVAGWALRLDRRRMERGEGPGHYYTAAMLGFALGCFALEVQGAGVQPALVSICPCELGAVVALGAYRGELRELFADEDGGIDP